MDFQRETKKAHESREKEKEARRYYIKPECSLRRVDSLRQYEEGSDLLEEEDSLHSYAIL